MYIYGAGVREDYSHPPKVSDKACRRRQYAFVRRGDATPYEAFGGWLYFAAARLLQPLAEAGDTRAMSELGGLYLEGLGVDEDRAAGKRWLEKAAQAGDAGAAEFLQIREQAR